MEKILAVVIPMYNEEMNAEKCIQAMVAEIQKNPGSFLFVVNDGSKDQTREVVQRTLKSHPEWPCQFVDYSDNRGYGAACLAGAKQAYAEGFQFAVFMDSDLTNDPKLVPIFLQKIRTNDYDVIKASRYIQGGGMEGVPYYRQQITIWGNRLASFLFGMGVKDCTNGFRAVRLSMVSQLQYSERGFPAILEELYYLKKQGARATEIPYVLTSRQQDEGQSKFSYSGRVIRAYLKYALKAALISNTQKKTHQKKNSEAQK